MPPAARITDFHACPMVTPGTPPIPHVGGPIMKGSTNVLTGKLPQARVGDQAVCVGPMDVIVKGSSGVFVNKLPAARIGDQTAHGGAIVAGCPTVIIGETKGGGGVGTAGLPAGAVAFAYADVVQQLQVLIDAHKSAAPFCEACFKRAVATDANLPTPEEQPLSFVFTSDPDAGTSQASAKHQDIFTIDWSNQFARLTKIANSTPPVWPAPPSPAPWRVPLSAPSEPKAQVQTWPVTKIVDAQDTTLENTKWWPEYDQNGEIKRTWCNYALIDQLQAIGVPHGELLNSQGLPLLANSMANALSTSPSYKVVERADAQALADQGAIVIAAATNPGDHGHVALVRPTQVGEQVSPRPALSNVGASVGVMNQERAFGSALKPKYYVLVR